MERDLLRKADTSLRKIFEPVGLSFRSISQNVSRDTGWDIVYETALRGMKVEFGVWAKSSAEPRRVYEMVGQLKLRPPKDKNIYPLFFAPYIGSRTAQLCQEAGLGYFDEAGNCWIDYKTILISRSVETKPPAPRRQSRRLFAPKSLRVIRALLGQPRKDWRQLELSKESGISLGLVNRIIKRLLESAFVELASGRVCLKDPKALLNEWIKAEALQDRAAVEYYTSEPLQQFEQRLDETSRKEGFRYALTLFSGARLKAPFVRTNRVHLYLQGDIKAVAQALGLKTVSSGGNVVIIPTEDEGVFYRQQRLQDKNVVSDIQLYVDLKNSHGRGEEQAEALAERFLRPLLQDGSRQPGESRTIEQEARLAEFLRFRDQGDRLMFNAADPVKAAAAFSRAMELSGQLFSEDRARELDYLRVKLWLARLQAAFQSQDRLQLQGANEVFPSAQDIEDVQARTWFNNGWIKFGLMVKAALETKWFEDAEAEKRFRDLFEIVTSPYTESSNDMRPRAEEVQRWLAQ